MAISESTGRARVVTLALSLVGVELLAGMQTYLSQTVLPLMASELDGDQLYGVLNASGQAAMFLTMPLGGWLLARFRIGPLFLWLTVGTVVGAVLCAVAVSMPMFIAGTVVRSLAGGGLVTVSMGAVSRGLPPRWRQVALAGMSGVWVISSLLGPLYAVYVSATLGWRWAMVIYLPLILVVRTIIARNLPPRSDDAASRKAPWGWSVCLSAGALLLSVPVGVLSVVGIVGGGLLMVVALRALLPGGSLLGAGGRRAALSALFVMAGVYFGAVTVLSVVAHDAFGLQAHEFGFVIAAPGLGWAVFGLWTGARPAVGSVLRRRLVAGGFAVSVGLVVLVGTTLFARTPSQGLVGLLVGAAVMGMGMGTMYPDILGRCLAQPERDDGISQDHMAAAVALAENTGAALVPTVAFALLGTGFGLLGDPLSRAQALYLGLVPLAVLMLHRLFAASSGREHGRAGSLA
jgi:MFS family permease